MHVLIFALSPNSAEEIQSVLGDAAERYTVAVTWSDVMSSLAEEPPDLLLIERAALRPLEPTTLLSLTQSGRWPPLILINTPREGARDAVALTVGITQSAFPLYQIADLRIDTRKKRVGLGERWVTLPPLQYRLLLALAKRAGEVVSYRQLLRDVWGYEGDDSEARELLKVHVRQIRRRLQLHTQEQDYIRSVRGFGYMLAPPDED